MVRKVSQTTLDKAVNYYVNNNVRFIDVFEKFKVNSNLLSRELKRLNIKVDPQRTRRGQSSWNKGLNKYDDIRVAGFAKSLSKVKMKNNNRHGYQMIYVDELKKSVKLHNYVWYQNTGNWPNGKKGEQVHHIDGNKSNNDFSNLLLVGVNEHSKIHKEYEQVFFELLKLGLIKFNKDLRGVDWQSFNQLIEKLKV
jgi:hypothetical protein